MRTLQAHSTVDTFLRMKAVLKQAKCVIKVTLISQAMKKLLKASSTTHAQQYRKQLLMFISFTILRVLRLRCPVSTVPIHTVHQNKSEVRG